MRRLARWHIWLGWAVAIPLLLWTVSGLFMALRPIDEVRGEEIKAPIPAVATGTLSLPAISGGRAVESMTLAQQVSGPVWIVKFADGPPRRANAATGQWMPAVSASEAQGIATAAYAGEGKLEGAQRFDGDHPPLELRRARPSWQLRFSDGAHLYVDADTGEVMAVRTSWWRAYDFMWGLHIMAPREREDSSHAVLLVAAALSLVSVVMGSALLFRRRKARVKHTS